MNLACSTLSFDAVPLAVAVQRIVELGFEAVDLACIDRWAHVSPWDIVEEATAPAQQIKQIQQDTGTRLVALNCGYELRRPEQEQSLVEALCTFARELGVGVVSIPAPAAGVDMEQAARRLARLNKTAEQMGRTLCVETHLGRLTETPAGAAALAEAVPGLALTLDASHFLAKGIAETEWRALYPLVRHVHLRDAGGPNRQLQTRWGEGDMPLEALVQGLAEAGYQGALTVEYIRPEKLGLSEDYPLEVEIRALRDRLRALLA